MNTIQKTVKYYDNLNNDELGFLTKTYVHHRKNFFKIVHIAFLIFTILLLFLFTIANFTFDENNIDPLVATPLSPSFVLQLAVALYSVFIIIFSVAYFLTIYKYKREIRKGMKIVEITRVKQKQYMPQNNKYYLHLNSITKTSIEVSKKDYDKTNSNDEINIEYTPYTDTFLGYY